jgi:hypothetical protein
MTSYIAYALFGLAILTSLTRPGWAFALTLSMYAFEQLLQSSGGPFLAIPSLTNIVVALCVGIAALGGLLRMPAPFLGYASPAWSGTLALLAFSALSLLWTPASQSGSDFIREGLPYFVLFVLTAPLLLPDVDAAGRSFRALLIVGTGIAATLMANPEFRSMGGRAGIKLSATVTSNPLATGELGGMLVIAAILLRPSSINPWIQASRISGLVFGAAIAFMSGSRGQALFAIVAVAVLYPVSRRVKSIAGFFGALTAAALVAMAIALIAPLVLDQYGANRWSSEMIEEGLAGRTTGWVELIEAALTTPTAWVLGLGFNAYNAINSAGESMPYSHNVPLDILTELGVPAFILFLLVLRSVLRDGVWLFHRWSEDPDRRATVATIFAFALYYFLLANKQGHLWNIGPFFLFLAVIARIRRREEYLDQLHLAQTHAMETDSGSESRDEPLRVSEPLTPGHA